MSPEILYACACVLFAAIVRGFSGFGFAMLTITSISVALPPATGVPAMFLLEVAAGVHLLPSIWKHVHWRSIGILVGMGIAFTPPGVYLLANVPADPMKVALSVVVFASAAVLLAGVQMKRMPTSMETAATGAASGLLNGAFGMGGPPIIVFFLGSSLALEAGRASIIATFLATDLATLPVLFAFGLFTWDSIELAILSLPMLAAGVFIGSRLVGRVNERLARKAVLIVLMLLASMIGAQSLLALFAPLQ